MKQYIRMNPMLHTDSLVDVFFIILSVSNDVITRIKLASRCYVQYEREPCL